MTIILPAYVTIDELESLDPFYKGTHVEFNGKYYDHTRTIALKSAKGGNYELFPHRQIDSTWSKIGINTPIIALHHYVVDINYNFIASFITYNGSLICSLEKDNLLTVYMSKTCAFFKSLPYSLQINLKDNGMNVFDDYTCLKKIC